METLSSLKEKFKGAECVIETEKDYPDLKGFRKRLLLPCWRL